MTFQIQQRPVGGATETGQAAAGDEWVRKADEAYRSSTDFFDTNIRGEIEDALRAFDSRHPAKSKYNRPTYRFRHKVYRPKVRSMVRRQQAAASLALFSSMDVLQVNPVNKQDPLADLGAKMMKQLLQLRLKSKQMGWFLTVIGGYQDAMKQGVVASYNYWRFEERDVPYEVEKSGLDEITGEPVSWVEQTTEKETVHDHPCVDLIPLENLRFSPTCSWKDPIGTSPYVIRIVPMYVKDIKAKMEKGEWQKLSDGVIASAKADPDSTRSTRQGRRQEPLSEHTESLTDYDTVLCHENYMREGGEILVYWTLATIAKLTEPVPLEDVYRHGQIPITVGFSEVETHRVIPKGLVGIALPMANEINEVANQRLDNVALALNKQWVVRAGKNYDTSNLRNNIPGGVTLVQDPQNDVQAVEFSDVTGSSFQEQDRFNTEFDDLTGSFASSTVATQRNLNETVGGMRLLATNASVISEFNLRVFVETWLVPTLRQLAMLEKEYESDENLIRVAASQANVPEQLTAAWQSLQVLLGTDVMVEIDVGMDATDPNTRLQKFLMAVNQAQQLLTQPPPGADVKEISREIFSILGYGTGERFFPEQTVQQAVLGQAVQQAQQVQQEAQTIAQQLIQQAQKIIDKSQQREDAAEAAERALLEEQIQLQARENALLRREMAQAIRELQSDAAIDDQEKGAQISSATENLLTVMDNFDRTTAEMMAILQQLQSTDVDGTQSAISSVLQASLANVKSQLSQATAALVSATPSTTPKPKRVPSQAEATGAPA